MKHFRLCITNDHKLNENECNSKVEPKIDEDECNNEILSIDIIDPTNNVIDLLIINSSIPSTRRQSLGTCSRRKYM